MRNAHRLERARRFHLSAVHLSCRYFFSLAHNYEGCIAPSLGASSWRSGPLHTVDSSGGAVKAKSGEQILC